MLQVTSFVKLFVSLFFVLYLVYFATLCTHQNEKRKQKHFRLWYKSETEMYTRTKKSSKRNDLNCNNFVDDLTMANLPMRQYQNPFRTKQITHNLLDALTNYIRFGYGKTYVLGTFRMLECLTKTAISIPLPMRPAKKMMPNMMGTMYVSGRYW